MTPKGGKLSDALQEWYEKVSLGIEPSFRDFFKGIGYEMCSTAAMAQYNEQKQWLDETVNLFPAFTCFGYSKVTLAKSSNAMLQYKTQLWLL